MRATPKTDRFIRITTYLLIPLLLLMTWGIGGTSKLFAGGVPEWFSQQFGKTFLASFPGLTASFYSIAILETLAALIALTSLVRGEFLRASRPTFLYAAIAASLLLFVQLSVGKQITFDFAGSHDLFMYFAGSLVMLLVVRTLDSSIHTPRA
jgi:hypothetical protein